MILQELSDGAILLTNGFQLGSTMAVAAFA